MIMNVTIERRKDGSFIAYNPDESEFLLIGTGKSIEECKADFLNTIEETVDSYREFGDKGPDALSNPDLHFRMEDEDIDLKEQF